MEDCIVSAFVTVLDTLILHNNQTYPDTKDISTNPSSEDIRITARSMYSDDVWDFRDEYPTIKITDCKIDFNWPMPNDTCLTDEAYSLLLEQVKAFVYSLIIDPTMRHPKINSIVRYVKAGPRRLVYWMAVNYIENFSDLTEKDIDNFKDFVQQEEHRYGGVPNATTLSSRLDGLNWLYEQRDKITHALHVDPWRDVTKKAWADNVTEGIKGQGKTPEIPNHVLSQLFSAAYRVLDTRNELLATLAAYHKQISINKNKKGNHTFKYNAIPNIDSYKELNSWLMDFRTAGYIIIATLTGMRVNEMLSLKTYCLQQKSVDGAVIDYLSTRQRKYLPEDKQDVLWQAPTKAIEVVNALAEVFTFYRINDFLFCPINPNGNSQELLNGCPSHGVISIGLKTFSEKHDIANEDGNTWNLTTHQFRKTFARAMIRKGVGLFELMKHLKQVDIEVTRRYGEMELTNELAAEEFVVSREKADEYLAGSAPIMGGGRYEMYKHRKKFIGMTRDDREQFLDAFASSKKINSSIWGDCMYDPAKALCGGNANNCFPDECKNSSTLGTEANVKLLEDKCQRDKKLLRTLKSRLQKTHIKQEIITCEKLLSQLNDGENNNA